MSRLHLALYIQRYVRLIFTDMRLLSTRWRTRCNLRQDYVTEANFMVMNLTFLGSLGFIKNHALIHLLSQQEVT